MRLFIVLILAVGFSGCGSQVKLKGPPVSVSGKVSQSGQAIAGVMMVFQPLGEGHVREFPLRKDGSFNGEMISGKYAYYLAKPVTFGATPVLKKLCPKYFEADISRTVTVESD